MLTPIEYYSIRNQRRIEKFVELGKQLGCNTNDARFKDSKYGCTYLGSGAFASTYTLLADKSVVVKTFPVRSRDCYPEYMKWCLDRQDSPYVPKIYKVQQINGRFYVYMKKYKSCYETEAARWDFKLPSVRLQPPAEEAKIKISVPKFRVKYFDIPKYKPAVFEKPIWQKDNRRA